MECSQQLLYQPLQTLIGSALPAQLLTSLGMFLSTLFICQVVLLLLHMGQLLLASLPAQT